MKKVITGNFSENFKFVSETTTRTEKQELTYKLQHTLL